MTKLNSNTKEIIKESESAYEGIKDNVEKTYEHLKPKAEELVSKVCDTVSEYYHSSKDQAASHIEDYIASINSSIRKQPMSSILIAAGIGFLLAKFKKL